MTEIKYNTKRIIDGKPPLRTVIVDEDGKVINKNPTKDELKGLEIDVLPAYTRLNKKRIKTCCSCESHDTYVNLEGYERWFTCNCRREKCTNYLCKRCYNREDPFKDGRSKPRGKVYTEEQLKSILRQFEKDEGKIPTKTDFEKNPGYPSPSTYQKYFGSWTNALESVGMDVESMVKKGIIETDDQRRRFSEMIIRDSFDNPSIDLAGENRNSPCDGICPNGKMYDVKSSKLRKHKNWLYYGFNTNNKHKDKIEIYYLLGFNKDWTKLDYGWRIPGEIAENNDFYVGFGPGSKYNIEIMEDYNITDKLTEVLTKYGFFK